MDMASNTNVELYLEKHRISSVLQDLMQKIVSETPPDPIKFMIRSLQRLDEKSKSSHDSAQAWGNIQPLHAGSGPTQHKKSRGSAIGKSSDFRHSTTTSSQDWQTLGSTDGNTVGSRSRDYSKPWLSGSRSSSQKVNLSNDNKFRKGYSEEDQQNFENQQNYKLLDKGKKEDPLNAFFSQAPTTSSIGMKKNNKPVDRSHTWNAKEMPAAFVDSIQSISNRKLPQSDYLLSDELKHHGKYYDEHLTKSTNNANINKQRSTRYQQVKLLKNDHKKQLQELVNRKEDSKENHWQHQEKFVNNDEYDESNELLEDSTALAEEGVTRIKNRQLRAPVATRKAINRQGGVNVHSIIQSQFNKIMDQNDVKSSSAGLEDKDDDIATARSQISDTNSLSHIVSQPLWRTNQDDDALSTVSGSRAVESTVFSQGRYGYRSAEDFAHSSNTAGFDDSPEQVSSVQAEDYPGTSRSVANTINQPDSARTFTFDNNSRHVWRKAQSEVDDTDVSEAGWAPTSNDHFSPDYEDQTIVDKGTSSIGVKKLRLMTVENVQFGNYTHAVRKTTRHCKASIVDMYI